MGLDECIAEIITASEGRLSKEEAKKLLDCYKESTAGMSLADKYAGIESVLKASHDNLVDGMRIQVLRERATRVRQALKAQQDSAHFAEAAKGQGSQPVYKAFYDLMLKRENIVENSRMEPTWWLNAQLSKDGGQAGIAFHTEPMLEQAIDEFFKPQASRNLSAVGEPVRKLIEPFDTENSFIYTAANKAGGYMNLRPTALFSGRVALPEKVGQLAKEDFVNFVEDLMTDEVETLQKHGIFKHDDLTERLEKIYDLTTRGNQYDNFAAYADSSNPLVDSFAGKTANRLSDSIFDLPFKDGQAYREYFSTFNGTSHADNLQQHLRGVGRNLGLVRAFGPVPSAGFKFMLRGAAKAALNDAERLRIEGKFGEGTLAKDANPTLVKIGVGALNVDNLGRFGQISKAWLTEPNPEHWFKVLTGETEQVKDRSIANIGKAARGFTSLSRLLGFGHLTQWGDLPNTMAMFNHISDSPVNSFGKTLDSYLKAYNPANKFDAEHLTALGTALDIMHGNMLDVYLSGDSAAASSTRGDLFDKGFKLTGMGRLDWGRVKATNEFLNAHMASALKGSFEDMRPELRRMMDKADMTAKDFELLTTGISQVDVLGGADHLLPDNIKDADARFKYLRMQSEAAKIAVPRPGALEQAIITRGTQAGTVEGEIMRTIGLFKSFGIAMATRVLPWVADNTSVKGKIAWGTGMLLTYMMRDAVKQVMLGKTPKQRNFADPKP